MLSHTDTNNNPHCTLFLVLRTSPFHIGEDEKINQLSSEVLSAEGPAETIKMRANDNYNNYSTVNKPKVKQRFSLKITQH